MKANAQKRLDMQGKRIAELETQVAWMRKMFQDKFTEIAERTVNKIFEENIEATYVQNIDEELKELLKEEKIK